MQTRQPVFFPYVDDIMSLFLETCVGPVKISEKDAVHFRFWKAVLTASDLAVPVYAKLMIE